jgi:hypothetical protein
MGLSFVFHSGSRLSGMPFSLRLYWARGGRRGCHVTCAAEPNAAATGAAGG